MIFMVLSSWRSAIAIFHLVHLMNADWAPGGRQPSDQANRLGLWVHRPWAQLKKNTKKHTVTKTRSLTYINCWHKCAYDCKQLCYTVHHRTVLIVFHLILQTVVSAQTSSIGGEDPELREMFYLLHFYMDIQTHLQLALSRLSTVKHYIYNMVSFTCCLVFTLLI